MALHSRPRAAPAAALGRLALASCIRPAQSCGLHGFCARGSAGTGRSTAAAAYPHSRRTRRVVLATPLASRRCRAFSTSPSSAWAAAAAAATKASATPPLHARSADGEIAVLGGGLTGLSAAYYLSKFLPEAKITLYEGSDRLGGWAHSAAVDVPALSGGGAGSTVLFEQGPRVISPQTQSAKFDDFVFYELVHELGLEKEIWTLGAQSALGGRYIYYPDHLVNLSPPLTDFRNFPLRSAISYAGFLARIPFLFREPITTGLMGFMRGSLFRRREGEKQFFGLDDATARLEDVSIGAFCQKLLGGRREPVDNLVSALVHGVYGGDVWSLSVQASMFGTLQLSSAMARPPGKEQRAKGRLLSIASKGDVHLMRDVMAGPKAADILGIGTRLYRARYMGFLDGFGTLADALAAALRQRKNVTIKTGLPVTSVQYDAANSQVKITTPESSQSYDKVVSALYSKTLASLTGDALPSLASSTATTIQAVNLWLPTPGLNRPHRGFGYLVPASSPEHQRSGVLGALFDSDREAALPRRSRLDTVPRPGTKLTVLLRQEPSSERRTEDEAAIAALEHVQRALHIPPAELGAAVVSVKTARDCIPQQTLGHATRMGRAHHELRTAFGGRLAVAGASYTAPGVLPALRVGRDVAARIAAAGTAATTTATTSAGGGGGGGDGGAAAAKIFPQYAETLAELVGDTGLERFKDGRQWARGEMLYFEKKNMPLRFQWGSK